MLPSALYSVSFLAMVVSSDRVFGGSLKPACGHIAFLSMLSACRLGLRSWKALVWQNLAELSGVKEIATSGGVPPLIARTIASSSLPRTCLTVIHGYFCLMLSSTLVVTLPSRPEKLLHTVSVSGSCWALGSSVSTGALVSPPPAVQAATSRVRATRPTSRRLIATPFGRGFSRLDHELLPFEHAGRVEEPVLGRGQGGGDRALEHGVLAERRGRQPRP